MRHQDEIEFSTHALLSQGFRSAMLLLALVIGVLAVNLLALLGESARQYVLGEFDVLGKQTLIILPGRKETTGGLPPLTGAATRLLTLDDAEVLSRQPEVKQVAPLLPGTTRFKAGSLAKEILMVGTAYPLRHIMNLEIDQGQWLPDLATSQSMPVAVLGSKLKKDLFGNRRAVGELVRAGEFRYRIIGVLQDTGQSLGLDLSNLMFVPIANAMTQYNQQGLFRVFVEARDEQRLQPMRKRVRQVLTERHGSEDFTILSQDAVLSTFSDILQILTLAISAIGAISLVVAGILVMNVSLITAAQRRSEIGLLKALGATSRQVQRLFLAEAALVAVIGAGIGLVLAHGIGTIARWHLPDYIASIPVWAQMASIATSVGCALVFAWLPAKRAAAQAPVDALHNRTVR